MTFPIPFFPEGGFRGSRGYGADRSNVAIQLGLPDNLLKHAACDLMGPHGTPVLAMEGGRVVRSPYLFYPREGTLVTYAFEVQHPSFLARYCEIGKNVEVEAGEEVFEGQVIAYIGNQPGWDMLHLELYKGWATGPLTTSITREHAPFYRRKDVTDPTGFLIRCQSTAIRDLSKTYRYVEDGDGRKYLAPYGLEDL